MSKPKPGADPALQRHLDKLRVVPSAGAPDRTAGERTRAETAAERGASAATLSSAAGGRSRLTPDAARIEALEAEVANLRRRLADVLADERVLALQDKLGVAPGEAKLLAILWRKAPAAVSKTALHELLYGDDPDGGPEMTIFDVLVCRLRKIEALTDAIVTLWGGGLRLTLAGRARLEAMLGGGE